MKITFGMIVFNAASVLPEGMLRYCIENVYDIAYEIIIVEGATKAVSHYWDGDTGSFTLDGRSTDATIEIIKSIPDPENKILLIQRNGFWNGKTEMCNAYAEIAKGDYIWQLDSDEFYKKEDMLKIIEVLSREHYDAVHFYANHFWGNFNYHVNEDTGHGWGNDIPWKRIFRKDIGARWLSHEPPEFLLSSGCKCNDGRVLSRSDTLKMGIKLFHYSYVNEAQILFKSLFYRNDQYRRLYEKWRVNKSTKLIGGAMAIEFSGTHPEIIEKHYINPH